MEAHTLYKAPETKTSDGSRIIVKEGSRVCTGTKTNNLKFPKPSHPNSRIKPKRYANCTASTMQAGPGGIFGSSKVYQIV